MKKNIKTNRYQFLQKEEAWIIQTLIHIEKTKSPTDAELRDIMSINNSMLIKNCDPYVETFERFLQMVDKYEIEGMPESMTGFTSGKYYMGVGNGEYYRLYKDGKDRIPHRTKARQDKRNKAYLRTAAQYENGEDILSNAHLYNVIHDLEGEIDKKDVEIARLQALVDARPEQRILKPEEHTLNDFSEFTVVTKSPMLQRIRDAEQERHQRGIA